MPFLARFFHITFFLISSWINHAQDIPSSQLIISQRISKGSLEQNTHFFLILPFNVPYLHKRAKCTFSQRPLETLRGNRWFSISCSLSREYKWKWLSKMSCSLNPPPLGQKWFHLKLGRLKRLIGTASATSEWLNDKSSHFVAITRCRQLQL